MGKERPYLRSDNDPPRISARSVAYTVAHDGAGLQDTFDIAVVMTTILRPEIDRALRSVFAQRLDGRIQVLVGIDKTSADRRVVSDVCKDLPRNMAVTILDLGYSTNVRHGGLHPAMDGGALRTSLSYLANSRYVAYLDDDNWWREDHLSSLRRANESADYAYSLRWFVDRESGEPLCVDQWESVGVDQGFFADYYGGFVDPNCLMIDKIRCEPVLRAWSIPLKDDPAGRGSDRSVFHLLRRRYRHAATGLPTAYYAMKPNDGMQSRRMEWIRQARRQDEKALP